VSRRIGSAVLLFTCLFLWLSPPTAALDKVGVKGASATKMYLDAGQSYLVDTGIKIRSVSVDNTEIAEVTVVNPRQLKVTGKVPGSAILVYWTEAGVPTSVDVTVWGEKTESRATTIETSQDNPVTAPPPSPREEKEVAGKGGAGEKEPFLVAVLPVENLSGKPAPLKEIRQSLAEGLKIRGMALLPQGELERFMARHRMRYTGGINTELAQALLKETGTKAVLITSVEFFSEGPPPKFSFFARLVSTGDEPTVLWMKSIGMSGDEHPGLLGLGLILDPSEILKRAGETALDSMVRSVPDGMPKVSIRAVKGGRFRPKRFFRSPEIAAGRGRTFKVAVLPFRNIGTRKNAGELMALQFVNRLAEVEQVRVIEPGVLREEMLRRRIIMEDGISGPQADLLFSMLEADMVVGGNVSEYQDSLGWAEETKVGFSVLMFERKGPRVVWSSRSYNRGNDGVFFFDVGEVKTAAAMASEMVWIVVGMMFGKG